MIQSSKPKYRIRYRQCSDKNHGSQKLNFVCLNEKCCENSLICSMCREDTHKGHTIQPLKFYIQTIKQRYQSDNIDYSKQFQYLEDSRSRFLHKLRQSVESVAEEFQKLEQQIMQRFEILRNQIIQNQSKKNKFSQFYDSLTSQSEDSPEFLIQNYLPTKQIPNLENFQPIEELGKKLSTFILETRDNLFSDLRKVQKVETNLKFQEKLASSVTKVGHLYSQTNLLANCPTTMSAVTVDLVKNMQQHKIKIRIAKMKKGAFIHLGAIEKQLFNSLKSKAPGVWNTPANLGKLYFFNNQAVTFGHSSSTLKTFSQNSNIQISMSGNTMKIGMKKNSAQYNLANGNEYYFFFNLQGQVEIQLTYLKK